MANGSINLPVIIEGSSGVNTLNSLTGSLSIAAGNDITVTPSGVSITIDSLAASATLSNLSAPTVINQDLLPVSDDTYNLGWDSDNDVGDSNLRWAYGCFSEGIFVACLGNGDAQNGITIYGGNGGLQVLDGGGAEVDGGLEITGGRLSVPIASGAAIGFGNAPNNTGSIGGKIGSSYYNPMNMYNWGYYSGSHIATPSFPAHDSQGNVTILYAKSDGNWYAYPESGSESQMISAVAGTPDVGAGTLTNLPSGKSGDPTGYLQAKLGSTTIYIPYW